ncbi:MAG: hypothetical protein QM500_03055 [Methylococcales bacterium]
MKKIISTLVVGLLLVYFIDAAFQVDGLTEEMLVNNFFRFLLGFLMMGLWGWSEHKHKSKIFIYILIALVIGDNVFDYMQNISSFDFEMTLHDLYFFLWGALTGYFFHNTFIEKE